MNILITGATGGIGSELSKYLSQRNKLFLLDKDLSSLSKLKREENIVVLESDVTDFTKLKKTFKKIKDLDILINCAGILWPVGKFTEVDPLKWETNIRVNLIGAAFSCYLAIPLLLKSEKGKIINFAGGGAAYGRSYHTAYASAKAGLVRFTESLSEEYPNLDINVISPGRHKTNLWKSETHDKLTGFGDMNHLKSFIDFLISEKSNGITGRFLHYKDDWAKIDPKKLSKDLYTLRRIE
jgi:3-oxoacyl-[acyl-carrier protein] reductase